ncbi:YihY/virulence factor BrkB family protein [Streptomyces sp. 6N223]|uniref:YihY/virulence factor BrkB family protein n=1 Tax=Streptomyces sp. 6N223 TaxID=3457412 RepID=UPI003FD0CAD1
MESLTKRAAPAVGRAKATRAWAIYRHLDDRAWTRLAAAITFTAFLALFPMLALGAAVLTVLLPRARREDIERWITDQVPGISDRLDLDPLFANADTIGLIALPLLITTGTSWIHTMRGCLRAVWDMPEPEENPLLRRAKDLGILAGLGAVTLLSLGASALAMTAVHWATRWLGLERGGVGSVLLSLAAYALALAVTVLLLAYLLVWLPGVRPPPRAVAAACVLGAIGFELLKALLGGYLAGVAARSLYGAFGVPIALLVWINLVARLLLLCCAWTATSVTPRDRPRRDALDAAEEEDGGGGRRTPPPPAAPGPRP